MAAPSLNSPNVVAAEHRGWKLQARWFYSFWGAPEGWVCYVIAPDSSSKLNVGRESNSARALEIGRAYVDRKLDPAGKTGGRKSALRNRHK